MKTLPNTTVRSVAIASSILGLATLVGCSGGHGAYTGKFKEEAVGRMNMVKAGTQWDMANQQYLAGDVERALETVDTSIALNDKVAKSHLLKGRILIELGKLEPALASLVTAQEFDAANAEVPYFKGVVLERLERSDEALAAYSSAAELDRTNPQYTVAAAEVLMHLGRLDEAHNLLEPAADSTLPRFTQNAGVRQTLGHIAMMKRDAAAAVRYFSEACTLAPKDAGLREDLARAQLTAGRFGDAEANLARILEGVKPAERRDLRLLRARCLLETERPVDARIMLQEMAQGAGASDPDVWLQLGNIALVLKDDHRLREAAGRVVALAPTRHEGYLLLGLYQRETGRLTEAAATLEKSLARTTDDPTPAIVLSLVYQQLGDAAKARSIATRAVAIAPNNERARSLAQQFGAVADVDGSDAQ